MSLLKPRCGLYEMLSGEHLADGKLCPMVVTDSSQRSERQGGLANGCVPVLSQEGTLIEMRGEGAERQEASVSLSGK